MMKTNAFVKDLFYFDGMYLTYSGAHEGSKTYDELLGAENIHPSRVGMMRPAFIARFKYGKKPWKRWVNFITKNFTVEEFLALAEETSPLQAMTSKGFKS